MRSENIVRLRVHITPIGYEVDRVTEPLLDMRADKVWLVVENKVETGTAAYYYREVTRFLEDHKLDHDERRCGIHDLYEILNTYGKIIEQEKRNEIFVNVSTGTKIHAIAGMMACMIFKENHIDINPYYVHPKYYKPPEEGQPYTSGYDGFEVLPNYKIERPEQHLIEALRIIDSKNRISKKDLIEACEEKKLIQIKADSDYPKSAQHSQLNKKIIEPLLDWKFITIEGKGKSGRVMITLDGKNILRFLS